MVACALCGNRFDPAAAVSLCRTCPAGAGCGGACCPNCGFVNVPDAAPPAAVASLAALAPGASALIADLDPTLAPTALRALIGLGLVPGATVRSIRRWPAIMVEVGARTVAVDRALARTIRLTALPA